MNVNNIEFCNACKEVLEILKYINDEDVSKIPKKEIRILHENANPKHEFHYDVNKSMVEQNVSKMAKAILAVYFEKYVKK